MGIFERIRQASPWVLTTFAIVFVGFMVLGDMDFSSMQQAGNDPQKRVIAEVGDKEVSYIEFENNVRNEIAAQRQQNQQQGVDQEVNETLVRRSVFSSMVDAAILEIEAEKMGINISDEVVGDYIAAYPPQFLRQNFTDSNGTFMSNEYLRFISDPENYFRSNPNVDPQQVPQLTQSIREQLRYVGNAMEQQILQSSVQVAMSEASSITSPSYLKEKYIAENSYADFRMVYLKTNSVTDDDISYTDEDLAAFYNKYSEQYKQQAQRKVKYASFKLNASAQDSINANKKADKVNKMLKRATTVQEQTKAFKDAMYEYGGETSELQPLSNFDNFTKSFVRGKEEGAIIGPSSTLEGLKFFRIAKIDTGSVSEVKASHILINFEQNQSSKDSALAVAKDIYKRAKRGSDFAELAKEYSKDPGSGANGGDLGYFGRGKMVPQFEQAAFDAEIGEVTEPVESQFGYHIIKVEDKVKDNYQIETISFSPKISSNTKKQVQLKARDFQNDLINGANWEETVEKYGAKAGETAPFYENQPILGSGYITSFAFANEVGKVSKPLELDNFGITIVMVSEAIPEGIPSLETVRKQVENVFKNNLKRDFLMSKAKAMHEEIMKTKDLESAKLIDPKVEVRRVSNAKNNGIIQGVGGREHAVSEVAYSQEVNQISEPIRGVSGVFIVQTLSVSLAQDELVEKNLDEFIQKEMQNEKRQGYYPWFQEMKKHIDLEDKRADIYTKY